MIDTVRLMLRAPEPRDSDSLRAMWADPVVTADLGGPRDAAAADAIIARHDGYRRDGGIGFWVAARREDGTFLGYCGLKPGNPQTPIAGGLEIGWALVRAAWGQGLATEAARAILAWGWAHRPERRIVAITSAGNAASRRVMGRIGMRHVGDFEHAGYPPGHPSRASVIYAVERPS